MSPRTKLISGLLLLSTCITAIYLFVRPKPYVPERDAYFFQDDPLPDSSDLYALCFYNSPDYIFRFLRGPLHADRYGASFRRVLKAGRDSLVRMGGDPALLTKGHLILVTKIGAEGLPSDSLTVLQEKIITSVIEEELKRKVMAIEYTETDLLFRLNKNQASGYRKQ